MKAFLRFFLFFVILGMTNFTQVLHSDKWKTLFELSDSLKTSNYKESMEYFSGLVKQSENAEMFSFGLSPQGRDLYCIIMSSDKAFTPEKARKTMKPIVLINNGIHSGEIEGKDASMLLLRDLLLSGDRQHYLDSITLMIVPIFSVDAHERFGKYNRINQNGPEEMGWRTTAQNLNLNRDWLKADAPEMQAMLKLISEWLPDFFIDTHTTDGADFQYDAMYGIEKFQNCDSGIAAFMKNSFAPSLEKSSIAKGILAGPYVEFKEGDVLKGIFEHPGTPRYSTGYFAARNRPALLIETHMLKPYKRRVISTKSILESTLEFISANASKLRTLNNNADISAVANFFKKKSAYPVKLTSSDRFEKFYWHGVKYTIDSSIISGGERITYSTISRNDTVKYFNQADVVDSVIAPYGYIIPAEWSIIADRMKLHGISMRRLSSSMELKVTSYKFTNPIFAQTPYEGRQTVTFNSQSFESTRTVPAGSYFVPCNQPCIKLILAALEPRSEDSFIRWGFMNQIFEKKEYYEPYVMEQLAAKMLSDDPSLKKEFESLLKNDKSFRKSPSKRLDFFYEHSPYYDKSRSVYPILRVENEVEIL